MAKLSMIHRDLKRKKLIVKFSEVRKKLKEIITDANRSEQEKWDAQIKLQKLPVNSSPSRLQNRCIETGRPRGVYRKFGLCRNSLRRHAMLGDIPGLKKASW
jgi:small subunit ribosomal protein S14